MAKGASEAHATGAIASYAVGLLYQINNLTGIKRLEEIIEFDDFIQYLQKKGISILIRKIEVDHKNR